MPAGIITRFIVRTHDICRKDTYWKGGVILEREKTEALVISERLNRKIRIWIRGEKKSELLAIIRREIDYIHTTLNDPDVKEMIPCMCSECRGSREPYFHNYLDLMKARRKGKRQIECKKSFEAIGIEKLSGAYHIEGDEMRAISEEEFAELERGKRPSITIEQQIIQRVDTHEKSTQADKKKWYKKTWAIIAGIIVVLGGIWTVIQICQSKPFKNIVNRLFGGTKVERIEKEGEAE